VEHELGRDQLAHAAKESGVPELDEAPVMIFYQQVNLLFKQKIALCYVASAGWLEGFMA
jgi:hypothetical protein